MEVRGSSLGFSGFKNLGFRFSEFQFEARVWVQVKKFSSTDFEVSGLGLRLCCSALYEVLRGAQPGVEQVLRASTSGSLI